MPLVLPSWKSSSLLVSQSWPFEAPHSEDAPPGVLPGMFSIRSVSATGGSVLGPLLSDGLWLPNQEVSYGGRLKVRPPHAGKHQYSASESLPFVSRTSDDVELGLTPAGLLRKDCEGPAPT